MSDASRSFGPNYGQTMGLIAPRAGANGNNKQHQELKTAVHRELLTRLDLSKLTTMQDTRMRMQVASVIQDLIGSLNTPLSSVERETLSREVLHEVFGLGPVERLLQDSTVNDILVNTHKQIYVERGGLLEKTGITFIDVAIFMHIRE